MNFTETAYNAKETMGLKLEGFGMPKWNIPTDETQRVNEKNGVICLVIMFTPKVMVIKMSDMAHFSYFLLMRIKNQSQSGQNIEMHLPERSYWVLSENLSTK